MFLSVSISTVHPYNKLDRTTTATPATAKAPLPTIRRLPATPFTEGVQAGMTVTGSVLSSSS